MRNHEGRLFGIAVGIGRERNLFGKSEIKDLNVPSFIDCHVRGLDIAMNYSVMMRFSQGFPDLLDDLDAAPDS